MNTFVNSVYLAVYYDKNGKNSSNFDYTEVSGNRMRFPSKQ